MLSGSRSLAFLSSTLPYCVSGYCCYYLGPSAGLGTSQLEASIFTISVNWKTLTRTTIPLFSTTSSFAWKRFVSSSALFLATQSPVKPFANIPLWFYSMSKEKKKSSMTAVIRRRFLSLQYIQRFATSERIAEFNFLSPATRNPAKLPDCTVTQD